MNGETVRLTPNMLAELDLLMRGPRTMGGRYRPEEFRLAKNEGSAKALVRRGLAEAQAGGWTRYRITDAALASTAPAGEETGR